MPRVTVLIPTFNYQAYLAESIESALHQTYRDREVVVVDDGSTDQTPDILERYGRAIRVIRTENGGTPSALNAGIAQARGEWIAWLSSDDAFEPAKLARQLEFAAAHPECAVIYTDWYVVDAAGQVIDHLRSPDFPTRDRLISGLLRGCVINGSTTLVRRSAYERAGPFDETLRQAHDWDMWLRLAHDSPFGHVPEPLVRYRWHGGNMSAGPDALAYNARVLEKARTLYGSRISPKEVPP
jgi:glycosyltransferase involved in cell wall biosynthesis